MKKLKKNKKKIIIFGNTGFVGSWLSELLLLKNYSVIGYSLTQNTNPSLHKTLNHKNRIKSQFYADVLNQKKMIEILKKIKPNIIVYLASQPLVIESIITCTAFHNSSLDVGSIDSFNDILNAAVNQVRLIRVPYRLIAQVGFVETRNYNHVGFRY